MPGLTFESSKSRIGCSEHAVIVERYRDWGSMHQVAESLDRSTDSVKRQIALHNIAIRVSGRCPRCRIGNREEVFENEDGELVVTDIPMNSTTPVTVTKKRNRIEKMVEQ